MTQNYQKPSQNLSYNSLFMILRFVENKSVNINKEI